MREGLRHRAKSIAIADHCAHDPGLPQGAVAMWGETQSKRVPVAIALRTKLRDVLNLLAGEEVLSSSELQSSNRRDNPLFHQPFQCICRTPASLAAALSGISPRIKVPGSINPSLSALLGEALSEHRSSATPAKATVTRRSASWIPPSRAPNTTLSATRRCPADRREVNTCSTQLIDDLSWRHGFEGMLQSFGQVALAQ